MSTIKLTVLYEPPFWVGIFEKEHDGKYSVSRTIFGSEPKDFEVYDFVTSKMNRLSFSEPKDGEIVERKINPKRLQQKVKKEVKQIGINSKAQDALRLEQEKNKKAKRSYNSKRKEEMKQEMFELKQLKKKEKKRGH